MRNRGEQRGTQHISLLEHLHAKTLLPQVSTFNNSDSLFKKGGEEDSFRGRMPMFQAQDVIYRIPAPIMLNKQPQHADHLEIRLERNQADITLHRGPILCSWRRISSLIAQLPNVTDCIARDIDDMRLLHYLR